MTKLVTHSGRIMDLSMPLLSAICIEDIAHHLARIGRFNGATDRFYSVAEHSVYCSRIVTGGRARQFQALMHDATEAYVGDCVSPLKHMLPEFKKIEEDIWISIALKFGMRFQLYGAVHLADQIAYVTERTQLITSRPMSEDPDISDFEGIEPHALPLPIGQDPEELFLRRFKELRKP